MFMPHIPYSLSEYSVLYSSSSGRMYTLILANVSIVALTMHTFWGSHSVIKTRRPGLTSTFSSVFSFKSRITTSTFIIVQPNISEYGLISGLVFTIFMWRLWPFYLFNSQFINRFINRFFAAGDFL